MVLDIDIALLGAADLFSVLSDEQRRLIAFGGSRVHLLPGDQLYSEGAQALGAYVLDTGVLESVTNRGSVASDMRVTLRGDMLGEAALITPTTWPTTMIAREACNLIFIERDLFARLLREYPELAAELEQKFQSRIDGYVAHIDGVKPLLDSDT